MAQWLDPARQQRKATKQEYRSSFCVKLRERRRACLASERQESAQHPQEQRNLEEPIRKAKEEAAKVTSRTEVLQGLLTLLHSLLIL